MNQRFNRARFLSAGFAVLAGAGIPLVARAQVTDPIADKLLAQIFFQQTQQTLQASVTNKVSLANDLNTLRLAQGLIFDHESFIQGLWPLITANLSSMQKAWSNVSLLNNAGSSLIAALSAQYPKNIDGTRVLTSVLGRLQTSGIQQIGQWMGVLQQDHQLAQQEMQRNASNVTAAQAAQTMNDLVKSQINVASAATNIAGAQETDLQALNGQMATLIQSFQVQNAAENNASQADNSLIYGGLGNAKYHAAGTTAPVTDAQVLTITNAALNVPILQAPAPASTIRR